MFTIEELTKKAAEDEILRDFKADLLDLLIALERSVSGEGTVLTQMYDPIVQAVFTVDDDLVVEVASEWSETVILQYPLSTIQEFAAAVDSAPATVTTEWSEEDAFTDELVDSKESA